MAGRLIRWLCCLFIVSWTGAFAAWQPVPGQASSLAVGPDGEPYALGPDGAVWHWRAEGENWSPLNGKSLKRIAIAIKGRPWGIATDGEICRFNGLWWESLEKRGKDIAVDARGNAYAILADNSLARWEARRAEWEKLPGSARRLAVTPAGQLWIIDEEGFIRRRQGEEWVTISGKASEISAGLSGVHVLDEEGQLWLWQERSERWKALPVPEKMTVIAAGPPGMLWIASASGGIFASKLPVPADKGRLRKSLSPAPDSPRKAREAAGAALIALGGPNRLTDPAPIEFTDTRTMAAGLSIGADGSVFALALDGSLMRWSNTESRFIGFPGNLIKLAVDPAGRPWGINVFGRIFRHDGIDWRQVRGTGSDITIAADGLVMVADASAVLWRYEPTINGLLRREGNALLLAAEADGTPWGLLADGSVVRCAEVPCEHLERRARSMAIGPDGSVFIVTPDGRLERRTARGSEWQAVPVPGHTVAQVAVGPQGRPWVISSTGKVLASAFFPRDESGDRLLIAQTRNPTTGSGDMASVVSGPSASAGFTFTKSLRFRTYPTPLNFDGISVGADGSVYAIDTTHTLAKFDFRSKTFKSFSPLPPEPYQTVYSGPDGALWVLSGGTDGRVFRLRPNLSWETFNLPGPRQPCMGPPCMEMNTDMSVGVDGAVYVLDSAGALYWKKADATAFTRLLSGPFYRLAAGRPGDVWVITPGPAFELFQLVAGRLEPRPTPRPAQVVDVAAGADGSVYVVLYGWDLAKWNPANNSFDKVKQQADSVGVGPDGRPWTTNFAVSADIQVAQ